MMHSNILQINNVSLKNKGFSIKPIFFYPFLFIYITGISFN
jgi:hypothetical protein